MALYLFPGFFKPDDHDADWKECREKTPQQRIAPAAVSKPAPRDSECKGDKNEKRCRRKNICQLNNPHLT
jgi:hypothetical protein